MKKSILALIALVAAATLAACSGGEEAKPAGDGPVTISAPTAASRPAESTADASQTASTDTTASAESETPTDTTSQTESVAEPSTAPVVDNSKPKDAFYVGSTELKIGMSMNDSVISAIGTPNDTMQAPSCHFDGNDTIYVYDGYSLYTYQDGDKSVLYLIEINSSAASTSLGATVGMSYDEVRALYGTPSSESASLVEYEVASGVQINFSLSGGTVTMIEYCEK